MNETRWIQNWDDFRGRVLRTADNGYWGYEVRTNGGSYLHNLTNEAIDRIRRIGERGFIVVDTYRDKVCVRDNPHLDLEYECRKENGMPGILTDEMKSEWLLKRNNYVGTSLRAEFLANQHCYLPIYCFSKADGGIKEASTQYIVYTNITNSRDNHCTWEELLGFGFAMCRRYKLETLYAQKPNEDGILYDLDANHIEIYKPKYDYAFIKSGPEGMGDRIAHIQRGEISV